MRGHLSNDWAEECVLSSILKNSLEYSDSDSRGNSSVQADSHRCQCEGTLERDAPLAVGETIFDSVQHLSETAADGSLFDLTDRSPGVSEREVTLSRRGLHQWVSLSLNFFTLL